MKEWKKNERVVDLMKLLELKSDLANKQIEFDNSTDELADMEKNKDKYIKAETEKILKNNKHYQEIEKKLKKYEAERNHLEDREKYK